MYKPIFKPYFLIALVLYIAVHLGRLFDYPPLTWINSYLTDFLCMPIILTLCLVGVRFVKQIPHFSLSPFMIFGMTLFYAILFEWILPNGSSTYTSDFLDVIMYFAGAGVYWLICSFKRQDSVIEASS